MRTALVYPPAPHPGRTESVPHEVSYVMAFLADNGYGATGFDLAGSVSAPHALVERHELASYNLVVFWLYNDTLPSAVRMAAAIRGDRAGKTPLIAAGGPQATALHDRIIELYPSIDAVVRGEGEDALLALSRALDEGASFEDLPSTTWRRADGSVEINPEGPLRSDLDALPFPDAEFVSETPRGPLAFFDSRRQALKPALEVATSRGCPYSCGFCGVLITAPRFRARTPANVVAEVRYFRDQHALAYSHLYLSDPNFLVSHTRALEVAEALHDFDPSITFSFATRVNQVVGAEATIERMVPLGLRFIELGIESASPTALERLSKGVTPEASTAAIQILNRLGVEIVLNFIMVDPATTVEDLRLNVEFLEKNALCDYYPHDWLYTSLALYEGTPVRRYFEQRLGRSFAIGELPDTRELLEHEELVHFWDTRASFRERYQSRIDRVLADSEALLVHDDVRVALRERTAAFPIAAQLQLDVIALRHAPSIFLRRLVNQLSGPRPYPCVADDVSLGGLGSPAVDLTALLARTERLQGDLRALLDIHPERTTTWALQAAST